MIGRLKELARGVNADVAGVLLTATGSLLVLEYVAIRPVFLEPRRGPIPLVDLGFWSGSCFVLWFVVPALLTRFAFRTRLRDIGLSFRGVGRHLPLYLLLYVLVLPLVYLASLNPEFQNTYPFAAHARKGIRELVEWELIYGVQFFSLEFFFRGFMVFLLAKRFGPNAVFVMVVPYCMIHFHKPMPEAIGAIGAGLLLGILALRTGSIFGGVMIHWAVAITMDVLAILAGRGFG